MTPETINKPIERGTPEANRWVVVSCAEVAARTLQRLSAEVTPKAITARIMSVKTKPAAWRRLMEEAHYLRVEEFTDFLGKGRTLKAKNRARSRLNQKYAEINEDPNRNFSYLDEIILGKTPEENQ
jgi:hypothetical protein